jgi:hypothetical protein
VSRRRAVAAGIAAVLVYAALAGLSGALSPLARGPLLDGLGPAQPYRWVNPPPALASTNQPPSSGVFHVPLDANGSRPEVFVTSDNQITIIVPAKVFALEAGQIEVTLSVKPVDPAKLSPPGSGLSAFGNAYELTAAYQPSGVSVDLSLPIEIVLVYPVTLELHATKHQIATSPTGKVWTPQNGTDSTAQQQTEGPMTALGYVMVVGKKTARPSASPSASGGGSSGSSLTLILIVAAVCVGLVGLGLIVRGRSPR